MNSDLNPYRVFSFKNGLKVIVGYSPKMQSWYATAWQGGVNLGSTDLSQGIGNRIATIKYLRKAIAEKKNPKIKTVDEKLNPEPLNLGEIAKKLARKVENTIDDKIIEIFLGKLK